MLSPIIFVKKEGTTMKRFVSKRFLACALAIVLALFNLPIWSFAYYSKDGGNNTPQYSVAFNRDMKNGFTKGNYTYKPLYNFRTPDLTLFEMSDKQKKVLNKYWEDPTLFDYYTNYDDNLSEWMNEWRYMSSICVDYSTDIYFTGIFQVIPEELFYIPGEHMYIGNEYGFYMNVGSERVYPNLSFNHRFDVQIVIFDFTLIKPIFEGINPANVYGKIKTDVVYEGAFIYDWDCPSSNKRISPAGHDVDMNVSNIQANILLSNINEKNVGEEGYDPYNDDGFFITDLRNSTVTKYMEEGDNFYAEMIWLTSDIIAELSDGIPFVEQFMDAIGKIKLTYDIFSFIKKNINGDFNDTACYVINDQTPSTTLFSNRNSQIEDIRYNGLCKFASWNYSSDNEIQSTEFLYKVNRADNSSVDSVNVSSLIHIEISTPDTRNNSFIGEGVLFDELENLKTDEVVNITLPQRSIKSVLFVPQESGYYYFSSVIDGGSVDNVIVFDKNNNEYLNIENHTIWLDRELVYKVTISNPDNRTRTCSLRVEHISNYSYIKSLFYYKCNTLFSNNDPQFETGIYELGGVDKKTYEMVVKRGYTYSIFPVAYSGIPSLEITGAVYPGEYSYTSGYVYYGEDNKSFIFNCTESGVLFISLVNLSEEKGSFYINVEGDNSDGESDISDEESDISDGESEVSDGESYIDYEFSFNIEEAGDGDFVEFIPSKSGVYEFSISCDDCCIADFIPVFSLLNNSWDELVTNSGDYKNENSVVQYYLSAGKTYYIEVGGGYDWEFKATVTVLPPEQLREGSKGERVKLLQYYINLLASSVESIPALEIDGDYGKETAESVKAIQEMCKLEKNGIVDRITWNAIYEKCLDAKDSSVVIINKSSQYSKNVTRLQCLLNILNNNYKLSGTVDVDGYYGNQSINAVKKLQRKFGLSADGIVGKLTWEEFYKRAFTG